MDPVDPVMISAAGCKYRHLIFRFLKYANNRVVQNQMKIFRHIKAPEASILIRHGVVCLNVIDIPVQDI